MGINNLVWAVLFLAISVGVIEGTHTAVTLHYASNATNEVTQ